ncbi:DUF397 domain-containing protein [Streptomyces sp. CC210A]|uniref:DUF397 domain-containing protein n=1 Tax=Streptomyces sp. CC210A TaxID=2898184 RepID=UPI001F2991DC|nr:DUF397 domain-containing protein [Streptomyces sp. CC210A]
MPAHAPWQKSTYCAEGDACIHTAPAPGGSVRLTESSDPSGTVLTLPAAAWRAWRAAIERGQAPEGTTTEAGPDGTTLRLHGTPGGGGPAVTTTAAQWAAFAAGVRAGEFDHLGR